MDVSGPRKLICHSFIPVPGPTAVVRDRQHRDVTLESDEHDVIREIVDRKATDIAVCNTGHERSCLGKLFEVAKRLPNFSREPIGYLATALPVPLSGLAQLAPRSFANSNRLQRDKTSR